MQHLAEDSGEHHRRAQSPSTADGEEGLADRLSVFARDVEQQDDPHSTLVEVVRAAVELIPGCDEGSISVVLNRKTVTSEAASGALAKAVDELQAEVGQGPCLDAVYEKEMVRVPDMAHETRWPLFADRASRAGAAGMLAFQLYVEGDNLGALNLYSRHAGVFDDESEHVGLVFATHASVAYAAVRKQSDLVRAVSTRQVIGQAQGILMERHKITDDRAFGMLVKASQRSNVKLRDVADRLVRTGDLASAPSAGTARDPG